MYIEGLHPLDVEFTPALVKVQQQLIPVYRTHSRLLITEVQFDMNMN
jgi:hypothetical protein